MCEKVHGTGSEEAREGVEEMVGGVQGREGSAQP